MSEDLQTAWNLLSVHTAEVLNEDKGMNIRKHAIRKGMDPFLIAEVGISHRGGLAAAMSATECAIKAGFDAVKFQHYHKDITFPTGGGERHRRFAEAHLSDKGIIFLMNHAQGMGGTFICTARDEYAFDFLTELRVDAIKIGSGSMLSGAWKSPVPLIISTGMATDVELMRASKNWACQDLAFLHCVSSYPTALDDAHLSRITQLQFMFPSLVIGYSDHTVGFTGCQYATMLGAAIIEKHIHLTDPYPNPGQDYHAALLSFTEMTCFVEEIRWAYKSKGVGIKNEIYECEKETAKWAIPEEKGLAI